MGVINGGIESPAISSTEGGDSPLGTDAIEGLIPNGSANEDPRLTEIKNEFAEIIKAVDKGREDLKNLEES